MEIVEPPGMEDLTSQIQGMFQNMSTEKKKHRKLKISEAKKLLVEEEAAKLVNDEDLKLLAIQNVEQNGKTEKGKVHAIYLCLYHILYGTIDPKNPEWFHEDIQEKDQNQICDKFSLHL